MTWFEIVALLREKPMPGIPADLVAAIEAQTIDRPVWWRSDVFRLRWAPVLVGMATAFGAVWLSRMQKHPDAHAPLPIAARPQPVHATLNALLPSDETSNLEKGERREHSKS